jgi:urease accessory protein
MNVLKRTAALLAATPVLMLWADVALAHPGHLVHEPSGAMLLLGLQHPLTGMDHLLAMLAVGIWSALTHHTLRQAIWVPLGFFTALLIGAMLGVAGMRLPGIEPAIMASLLVTGLLVANRTAMRGWISVSLVGFFALFHGIAHGVALHGGIGVMAYMIGFMAASLALHLLGLFAGFQVKRLSKWFPGILGAGVATYGALLFIGI